MANNTRVNKHANVITCKLKICMFPKFEASISLGIFILIFNIILFSNEHIYIYH